MAMAPSSLIHLQQVSTVSSARVFPADHGSPKKLHTVRLLTLHPRLQKRSLRGSMKIRAADVGTDEVKPTIPDSAPTKADDSGALNQLLGIKGATAETNKWKIRLQLTKPVTWPPLIWGVVCGAAASGNFQWTFEDVAKSVVCMIMAGPCLTGYTQTINDWYDREIDAINEPYRPIPSGAISESEVIVQIWVLLLAGLGLAYGLDLWAGHSFPSILCASLGGSLLSYIYSAPPLKLKQNGWIGNFALGASYICLPWWAGQLLFGTLPPDVMVLTVLYSIAGVTFFIFLLDFMFFLYSKRRHNKHC